VLRAKRDFVALDRRGQIGRLRALGRVALSSFGLDAARMIPLRHEHNTTFRVDAASGRYVLRISRTGTATHPSIASEMAWLAALRKDTNLSVPEPVPALDDKFVVAVSHPGVPEPRSCVLLRWMAGRFEDVGLAPRHLGCVGELIAGLQAHAERWARPAGFVRQRVDTLTSIAKLESIAGSPSAGSTDVPTREDADRALDLVTEMLSPSAAGTIAEALDVAWASTRSLAACPENVGLIHGDLHQENYLFRAGEALAIDFDDCGWGFLLYDLAVALWELEGRPGYAGLRAALLEGYGRRRPLPPDADVHLRAFAILRRLQILLWILESRDHAAFRDDWHDWSDKELWGIRAAMAGT
jgi:Ser/Thr protein kinase RdoA (MazF antagonist)